MALLMRRRYSIAALFLISCAIPNGPKAVARSSRTTTVEPSNLPTSDAQLRLNIHKANLVAQGRIVAYEPPSIHDHVATLEKTTIIVEGVLAGNVKAGTTLTYSCFCHHEQSPTPAEMIGHQVLVFLAYDGNNHSWSPATREATYFYNDRLRDRARQMIRGAR